MAGPWRVPWRAVYVDRLIAGYFLEFWDVQPLPYFNRTPPSAHGVGHDMSYPYQSGPDSPGSALPQGGSVYEVTAGRCKRLRG